MWDYLRAEQRARSSSQFRKLCKAEYLHYLRVREWQDLFSQLRQVAGDLGIRPGSEAGHPDRVHQAVLAGLLRWSGTPKKARKYKEAESSSMRRSGMRPTVAVRADHADGANRPGGRRPRELP